MYKMKRYTAAEARARLSDVLDAAERGEAVVVERRGTRFSIRAEKASDRRPTHRRQPLFEWVDPAIEAGQWTWDYVPGRGLTFTSRPTAKRRT
jgi:antitoxin (DNA-binding transcriptional repressor) of toxin-antitoxin stability system